MATQSNSEENMKAQLNQVDTLTLSAKQLHDLRQMVITQGDNGNWNYDPYMQGMFNGMELMLATIEDREPDFKKAPKSWLHDKGNDLVLESPEASAELSNPPKAHL